MEGVVIVHYLMELFLPCVLTGVGIQIIKKKGKVNYLWGFCVIIFAALLFYPRLTSPFIVKRVKVYQEWKKVTSSDVIEMTIKEKEDKKVEKLTLNESQEELLRYLNDAQPIYLVMPKSLEKSTKNYELEISTNNQQYNFLIDQSPNGSLISMRFRTIDEIHLIASFLTEEKIQLPKKAITRSTR